MRWTADSTSPSPRDRRWSRSRFLNESDAMKEIKKQHRLKPVPPHPVFAWILFLITAGGLYGQIFDIVLSHGRVIDPESGLDAVRNIGINGKRIAAISSAPLRGRTELDVRGLVVSPGFIDLHSHGQDDENYHYKAHDGVTTALELEIGVSPVAEWYQSREGKALVNFGASSGHVPARMAVMHDTGRFLPRDGAANRSATVTETLSIVNAPRRRLDDRAIGIAFWIASEPTA